MTFVMAQCVPLDFTTSRYSEEKVELHDNRSLIFPFHSNTQEAPRIFDIPSLESLFSLPEDDTYEVLSRRSKSPQNTNFHSEETIRNFRTVDFKNNDSFFGNSTYATEGIDEESRKFSSKKKSELYSNFESNIIKNLNKNQTSKVTQINHGMPDFSNTTKEKNKNSSLYANFIGKPMRHSVSNSLKNKTNIIREQGVFKMKIQKPTTSRPNKFMTITHKPIIINLTKVPSKFNNGRSTTKPTTKTTRTPGWISKIKSSTPTPTTSTKSYSFGWPNNKIKNKNDWNRYKNYTDMNVSKGTLKKPTPNRRKKPSTTSTISNNNRKKPTKSNRVKYVPKPGYTPTIEEVKQNWYESGVPYPNPMPEISSNSPTFALPSEEGTLIAENLDSLQVDAADDNPITNAISTFNLDMRPAVTDLKDTLGNGGNGCPTVHISSSVLSPQQRQECSDLNLVINSHFHQNAASDRLPSIDTYQAENPEEDIPIEAVEDPVEEAAEGEVAQADPGAALADPAGIQADAAGGSPGTGGTGGSGANGGTGGNGGDGSNGGLGWPDLKGILDTVDWIGNKFGGILNFLKNPYLYIVPATLFFLLGFFLIIALFPWWIPLLFLFVGIKAKKKPNVVYHKHVHKPVHHPDGWFWDQHTKTWGNVQDYLHNRRIDNVHLNHIPQAIEQFEKKYKFQNPALKSMKKKG